LYQHHAPRPPPCTRTKCFDSKVVAKNASCIKHTEKWPNTVDATFGREIIGQHKKIKRFFFAGLDCHNIQRRIGQYSSWDPEILQFRLQLQYLEKNNWATSWDQQILQFEMIWKKRIGQHHKIKRWFFVSWDLQLRKRIIGQHEIMREIFLWFWDSCNWGRELAGNRRCS
jgi:hypothetical protein